MNFRGWQRHERVLALVTLLPMVAALIVAWFGLPLIGVAW